MSAGPRIGVVIGWPIGHSKSPAMHEAAFRELGIDARLVALAVPPPSLPDAVAGLAAGGILGASVTIPHKEAVVALCTRVEAPADRIGAVNCLAFPGGGEIVGHNTDAGGFVDALADEGVTVAGVRAVLLGAGGAARAVHAGLVDAGVADIDVVARRPDAVSWIDAQAWTEDVLTAALKRADLVVDCTSSALDPATEADTVARVPLGALPDGACVASLVYHRRPLLLERAASRGLRTVDGKGMLVHQGARAFRIWLGRAAPVDVMRAAL
jgi:shikimate dehydrogenase